ncbi:hypothetical protein ACJX0J_024817, partial [Zea mays]
TSLLTFFLNHDLYMYLFLVVACWMKHCRIGNSRAVKNHMSTSMFNTVLIDIAYMRIASMFLRRRITFNHLFANDKQRRYSFHGLFFFLLFIFTYGNVSFGNVWA